jgi:hypothetical protein
VEFRNHNNKRGGIRKSLRVDKLNIDKMKKIMLTTLFAIFFFRASNAQVFEVKGGFNLSNLAESSY